MCQFKKMLVCLDLSSIDEKVVKYVTYFANNMGVEKVEFAHVIETDDLPKEAISEMFPDLKEPIDQVIYKDLKDKVYQCLGECPETEIEITLKEGNASDCILHMANESNPDLLVLGKKVGYQGTGILSGKLIRLIHCSVMVLPETCRTEVNHILTPVDFSQFSRMALEQSLLIANQLDANVSCQYVYHLSTRYFPYIPSKDLTQSMEKRAKEEYRKFLKSLKKSPDDIPLILTQDNDNDPANKIYDQAIREHADLVVVGSKGQTNAASYLIGSVAEKLTAYDKTIPLLIVKDKEENYGILDAIKDFYSSL